MELHFTQLTRQVYICEGTRKYHSLNSGMDLDGDRNPFWLYRNSTSAHAIVTIIRIRRRGNKIG